MDFGPQIAPSTLWGDCGKDGPFPDSASSSRTTDSVVNSKTNLFFFIKTSFWCVLVVSFYQLWAQLI